MERNEIERPEMTETELNTLQAVAYTAKLIGRESEVPMVSMDGEAHPNMTLAAVGLGVLVALIILLTLIAFITRRERSSQSKDPQQDSTAQNSSAIGRTTEANAQKHPMSGPHCVTFANDLELVDVVTRM
ncbi:uncharacterized protein LOC126561433 [Anopheles maculipalpis]|uniref:uncharacterized protein LOC126561433 n=1 Tax=Anopheles maculipalpis TaxID=1496333 RepID=UPI00215944CE|nr:uncharacterized protein LOC126561433 [Anopheles maculipalpis]